MLDRFQNWKNGRVYWLAFIAYWGIVLFGYDTGLAGGIVEQPYFQTSFGLVDSNGKVDLPRKNQVSSNIVSVLQAGAFFGALVSAPVTRTLGRKRALQIFTAIFVIVGAILTVVANPGSSGLSKIYAGRAISGFGIGAISAIAPAYVSECSPKDVRGRITGLFQIMVAIGVMLSYFINLGVGLSFPLSPNVWKVPFSVQLIPAGVMAIGLLTVRESPRWLASVGRNVEALGALAYLRNEDEDSAAVICEMAEIEAAIAEEQEVQKSVGFRGYISKAGNAIRFFIAFWIFVLQQWGGQNSVGYYAPQIFSSLGYSGTKNSLLASGFYGIAKVVATTVFIFFAVDQFGRKPSLFVSAIGMGTLFFLVGFILKMYPPPVAPPGAVVNPTIASQVMAGMLYIYVCFYSLGWGPLPWVYVCDIFPSATRHHGLSVASATQWFFNFVIAKLTPTLVTNLGYRLFFLFGTVNIVGMATFSMWAYRNFEN